MGVSTTQNLLGRTWYLTQRVSMEMSKCLILKSSVNLNVLRPYSVFFRSHFLNALSLCGVSSPNAFAMVTRRTPRSGPTCSSGTKEAGQKPGFCARQHPHETWTNRALGHQGSMNKSDRFQTQKVAWTRRTGLSHGTRRIPADREMILRSMIHPVVQTRAVQCQRVTVAWAISHRSGRGTTMPTPTAHRSFRRGQGGLSRRFSVHSSWDGADRRGTA